MKIAVFGHYDSRGGTMAIELPDRPTEADVYAAVRRYDRDVFEIEEPGGQIGSTAYGMAARECDKQVHDLIYGDESPGAEDFMFVADIHGDPPVGPDIDDGTGAVLEDSTSGPGLAPGVSEWHSAYAAWMKGGACDLRGKEWLKADREWYEAHPRPADYTLAERITITLAKPVQLEYVEMSDGYDADITAREKAIGQEREALCGGFSFSTAWTPEQAKEGERLSAIEKGLQEEREARITGLAKVIGNAEYRRWDDDAYGFIIMGR